MVHPVFLGRVFFARYFPRFNSFIIVNRQQAEFVRERFLSRFSGQYQKIDPDKFPVLEQILFAAGLEFNDTVRKNLEKAGAIASGALADVSVPQVARTGELYQLSVGYPIGSKQMKYFDFINKGVKGVGGKDAKPKRNSGQYTFKSKRPSYFMANAIARWLANARKKIAADRVDLSKVAKKNRSLSNIVDAAKSRKSLSFAIASAIKRDGIRATYYFDRAVNQVFNKDFQEALQVALGADIVIQIRQEYGNNNNR